MIKVFKHLSIWIIISLVIQFAGLYYINETYLKPENSFIINKVVAKAPKKQQISIDIPSDAININASYDGRFVSYCENGTLKTVDTSNGQLKEVLPEKGNEISFYNWVSDRHRLIIAEKPITGNGKIQLNSYDASKSIKNTINSDVTWSDSSSKVSDIQISPVTNLIYVKVSRNSYKSQIYLNNAMDDVSQVDTSSVKIGNIKILPDKAELVYEDLSSHKIISTNDKANMNFINVSSPIILGSDSENNIYVGNLVNGLITNIYYGNTEVPVTNWKTINVTKQFDPKDLFITENGNIYVNNNLKGQVSSLKSNQITSYNGSLIKMTDKGIVSENNGKLADIPYK
ncbi:hypothetical protein [Clostridium akagii]|uniref:hypothetical protein n=1 Tax=Clostridium akagii TaxID=91623 RepID=UPI00047EAB5F|nr:hypothetical protein [Clostridium akagii]